MWHVTYFHASVRTSGILTTLFLGDLGTSYVMIICSCCAFYLYSEQTINIPLSLKHLTFNPTLLLKGFSFQQT